MCCIEVAISVFVYNFSLMNYEYYTQHYVDFIRGHLFAVIIVLVICFFCTSFYFFITDKNIRNSVIKSFWISVVASIIVLIYIIFSIDYNLLS